MDGLKDAKKILRDYFEKKRSTRRLSDEETKEMIDELAFFYKEVFEQMNVNPYRYIALHVAQEAVPEQISLKYLN
jgi:hypothetical protein